MDSLYSPPATIHDLLLRGEPDPLASAAAALARANSNAGRNVYLTLDREWTLAEAAALPGRFPQKSDRPALYGVTVSLKDCFDLEGFPTSCGSRFLSAHNGRATSDSWVAKKLRNQGAVLTGKTHLHQLAYGITGQNSDYDDCLQPDDAALLTGGSSSGAAASVQEGSALAAIGTDTGGSIRVPAALCGLAGYRSSLGMGDWQGGAHLAPSFDTIGWLFRDLRDGPLLARALFDLPTSKEAPELRSLRIGVVEDAFLDDCEATVRSAFTGFLHRLLELGVTLGSFESKGWQRSFDIFSPIQASEAAALHAGHFHHFEAPIAERLTWGASLSEEEVRRCRARHEEFRSAFDQLFDGYDFLVLPCAPVSLLEARADHSATRRRILGYTTPASLAGTPVVAVPLRDAGVQLIAPRGGDAKLLAFAAQLGAELPL